MQNENLGVSKMANVLSSRVSAMIQPNQKSVFDFGTILDDYSLRLNTFPIPLPRTEYLVCRGTALPDIDTFAQTDQQMDHTHDIKTPEYLRGITPGDRVLVAWVGNDAVVLDIVVSASSLGG